MAGIFPSGGTDPANTLLAQIGSKLVSGCKALFYRVNCNPRFDPAATNALISEIVNAVNAANINYDCSKLNNLAGALLAMKTPVENMDNYDLKYPDNDDVLRGKFDGVEGKTSVQRLLRYAPSAMPAVADMGDNDVVIIGTTQEVNGESILYGQRITLANLKKLFGGAFGSDYRWRNVMSSRTNGVVYRNTTGSAIQVCIQGTHDGGYFFVSSDNENWVRLGTFAGNSQEKGLIQAIIPNGYYYRLDGGGDIQLWSELSPN